MKIILMGLLLLPMFVFAQTVDIKGVDTGEGLNGKSDDTTLIQIKKHVKDTDTKNIWEVQEGTADIEGDSAPLTKEAMVSWTEECNSWKKEFREDNKENKILSMSCGKAACESSTTGKTCTSKASYKVKTKIN